MHVDDLKAAVERDKGVKKGKVRLVDVMSVLQRCRAEGKEVWQEREEGQGWCAMWCWQWCACNVVLIVYVRAN